MISKQDFLIYAAYSFTCLEDRAWSFFVTIVLESIGGMYFVSIGQFSESFLQMIFGGLLGKFIDVKSRKTAIATVIFLNNLSIFVAVSMLSISDSTSPHLYISILFCALNRLFLNAEKSIIGRDWIVVLNDKDDLGRQNTILTGLDQLLNVVCPVIVGGLISTFGISSTLTLFAVGSLLSMCFKSALLYIIYTSNLSLHQISTDLYQLLPIDETGGENETEICQKSGKRILEIYLHQSTFFAAIGMTLFYKTVMGFDNLAVAYAKTSSSLSIVTIGTLKSFGAVAGMAGVVSYAVLEKKFGLLMTGYFGMGVQQFFSLLALTTIWMPGSPMDFSGNNNKPVDDGQSILVFLVAIACSRYGLWCLDLVVTHSMQVHVPECERNTVFGFHMALCQAFSVPKEVLVILFPVPSHFALYIISSYISVSLGHLFFYLYAMNQK